MKSTLPHDYRDRITDEAGEWFARLQDPEVSTADRAAFAAWLSASSEHVQEYLALTALYTDIGELQAAPTAEDLVRLAGVAQSGNVIPLDRPGFSPLPVRAKKTHKRWAFIAGLAAGIAVISMAVLWGLRPDANTALYTTAIGEQKSFTLPDGSVVTLNAVSQLRVRYTEYRRDIQLVSGEALFSVAKNPQRPFRVLTDDSVTQAVGTRFNVRHRQDDTTITVIEGRVKVSSPKLAAQPTSELSGAGNWVPLTAGQRARVGAPGVIDVSTVDTTVNTAWRDRRLVFESRPLSEVIAEFNLYNEVPIEIRDPALNDIQVSGAFYANDPRSFILFLEEAKLAQAQMQGSEMLLLPLK